MSEPEPHTAPPTRNASGTTAADAAPHSKRSDTSLFSLILVLIALAVFAASLNRPLRAAMRNFAGVLSPVLIGFVIAYLCDPLLTFFEYRLFRRLKWNALRRGLSLLLTVLTALGTLVLIGVLIIPRFYESLTMLSGSLEGHLETLQTWIDDQLEYLPFDINLDTLLGTDPESGTGPLQKLLDKLAPVVMGGNLSDKLGGVILGLFNSFKNVLLGLFISFYILASKEKRVAQLRKARAALLSEKTDRRICEVATLANNTFGGFIYGKLIDCLVIGALTFVMLLIFDISAYKPLIAAIVGIFNIIPVFGLFIGAIVSFVIVLVTAPSHALLFVVLMLIIQQLEVNVISPKILGDNTGISSLCVIVSISVCSALWGVPGMIIGVPFCAVIIELIRRFLEGRLECRGAPTDTLAYYPADAIGNAEEEVYYEHSHLRYLYDHSKLKPRIERFHARLFSISLRGGNAPAPTDDLSREINEAPFESPPEETREGTTPAADTDSGTHNDSLDNTDPS